MSILLSVFFGGEDKKIEIRPMPDYSAYSIRNKGIVISIGPLLEGRVDTCSRLANTFKEAPTVLKTTNICDINFKLVRKEIR